ncbi:siderophore-interacting protein [Mariniluteicoccus flavus]
MSNISVTHADSGVMRAEVVRSVRLSPHLQRVTVRGADLARLHWRGFDQWVRLALPANDPSDLDRLPARVTTGSYLRLQAIPAHRRPTIRSYTLRAWRPEANELDLDFVVHGTEGVAGPWALATRPGDAVALIDQGCGWAFPTAGWSLLAADETGLPAVAGILRDLPRDARGVALVEVTDEADAQEVEPPEGFRVVWLVRAPAEAPGARVLAELATLDLAADDHHAFAVGESGLATGVRRHLVRERGWAKGDVTFCGYWKR